MGVHQILTGAERAARYRIAKRAQGLRLKQFWVPDMRDPEVLAKIKREVEELNRRDRADGTLEYIDSLADDLLASLPPYGADDPPSQ